MLINADCTMYLKNDNGGFDRHIVKGVYWNEARGSTITKNGIQSADSVTVYLYSDKFVPKQKNTDMLVKGIVNFEFDNTSNQTVSQSMNDFRKLHPNYVTVTAVNDYMFGGLPHIEVSAK